MSPSLPPCGCARVLELDLTAEPETRARAFLSPAECQRADRFRFERDRAAWTVARASLRRVLAQALERDARELELEMGPHGKPHLACSAGLSFNLAHSGRRALVALARAPVGVDLERLGRVSGWREVAQRAFSRAEREWLEALPEPEVEAAFARVWTRREAVLKEAGTGFSAPRESFSVPGPFHAGPDLVRLAGAAARQVALFDLDLGPGWAAALAGAPDLERVELERWRA